MKYIPTPVFTLPRQVWVDINGEWYSSGKDSDGSALPDRCIWTLQMMDESGREGYQLGEHVPMSLDYVNHPNPDAITGAAIVGSLGQIFPATLQQIIGHYAEKFEKDVYAAYVYPGPSYGGDDFDEDDID